MGLIELVIVILVLMWAFGYFGRGRLYGRGGSSDVGGSNLIHTVLVIVVILVVLRLLRIL